VIRKYRRLREEGDIILRFWGRRIKKELDTVVNEIEREILARKK